MYYTVIHRNIVMYTTENQRRWEGTKLHQQNLLIGKHILGIRCTRRRIQFRQNHPIWWWPSVAPANSVCVRSVRTVLLYDATDCSELYTCLDPNGHPVARYTRTSSRARRPQRHHPVSGHDTDDQPQWYTKPGLRILRGSWCKFN
jgi:hypothetical protein